MAGNAPCTIPLRAVSGRFSGSRSPRCGGLIKRAMHHLPSRNVTRKMLHRTPSETAYTSSSRYPKMAIFGQIKTRHPKNGRTSTLTVWGDLGTIFLVTTRLERWCLGSPLSTPGTPKSHVGQNDSLSHDLCTTCARLVHYFGEDSKKAVKTVFFTISGSWGSQ